MQHAELGARIAGLEGMVFAMRRHQAEFDGQISALIKALCSVADSIRAAAAEDGLETDPRRPQGAHTIAALVRNSIAPAGT
jgi:hypothetical protein